MNRFGRPAFCTHAWHGRRCYQCLVDNPFQTLPQRRAVLLKATLMDCDEPLFQVPPAAELASGRIGQTIQDANLHAVSSRHGAMPTAIRSIPGSVTTGYVYLRFRGMIGKLN